MCEPIADMNELEPGGYHERLAKIVIRAVTDLAIAMEGPLWGATDLGTRFNDQNKRLDALEKKINETNELLRNLIKVMSSRSSDV